MNNVCKFILAIFVSIILASLFIIPKVEAAVFVVGSEQKTISVNENVKIAVGVDTKTERLNLFNVALDIPQEFDFVSLDKENSIINIWVKEPVFDSRTRKVSFIGGIPGGFIGRAGFINVILKPQKSGQYTLSVDQKSEAYLNDGAGTRASVNFDGLELEIEGITLGLKILILIFVGAIVLGAMWIIDRRRNAQH